MRSPTRLDTGKRGEFLVLGQLLERGASLYVPVVDAQGIDAIIRLAHGQFLEIQIKSVATAKSKRWFQVFNLDPRPDFYIIGVALSVTPPEAWIFPSEIFAEHATRSTDKNGKQIFDLDLDSGIRKHGQPLIEVLGEYLYAWSQLLDEDPAEIDVITMMSMEAFAENWNSEEDSAYDNLGSED